MKLGFIPQKLVMPLGAIGFGVACLGALGLWVYKSKTKPDEFFPFMTASECQFMVSLKEIMKHRGQLDTLKRSQKHNFIRKIMLGPKEAKRIYDKFNSEGIAYWRTKRLESSGEKNQMEKFYIYFFNNTYLPNVPLDSLF